MYNVNNNIYNPISLFLERFLKLHNTMTLKSFVKH